MQRTQQLRTATQTRRSARTGFPEPDDFEGLPVRQWRQEWVTVAPSLQQEMTQEDEDRWAVELSFGMPKEAHLLPPHTQELLRAARSGRLYKRPAPAEDEEADTELDLVKGEKKDWDPPNEGYMVKVWKQVPRNAEAPTISHLAKRHKNTVTLSSKAAPAPLTGPTVIRATVRRIDAAGNPYEQTVTLAEGQRVDGEIISTTVVPAPAAAQAELPAQQPTPVRRRPPPPKRKAKGVGRGRKKGKLPLPLPATRSQAVTLDGPPPIKTEDVGADEIKTEDAENSTNLDSEMADLSGMPSEDEEADAGEGEEDEEAGEGAAGDDGGGVTSNVDFDGDAHRREVDDTEMSEAVQASSVEETGESRPLDLGEANAPPTVANPGPPHPTGNLGPLKLEGSPLKNVMVQSPTEPSPSASQRAGNSSLPASNHFEVQPDTSSTNLVPDNGVGQADGAETTGQSDVSQLGEGPTAEVLESGTAGEAAAVPAEISTPAPPERLADASAGAPDDSEAAPDMQPGSPPTVDTSESVAEGTEAPLAGTRDASLQPPDSPNLRPTAAEDEDDGLNLLGSLEKELDRQESKSSAGSGSDGKVTPNPAPAVTTATTTTSSLSSSPSPPPSFTATAEPTAPEAAPTPAAANEKETLSDAAEPVVAPEPLVTSEPLATPEPVVTPEPAVAPLEEASSAAGAAPSGPSDAPAEAS